MSRRRPIYKKGVAPEPISDDFKHTELVSDCIQRQPLLELAIPLKHHNPVATLSQVLKEVGVQAEMKHLLSPQRIRQRR